MFHTNKGFDHASGIKNQPVPIITPKVTQADVIGKFFITPPLDSIHKKEDLPSYWANPLLLVLLRCMRHLHIRRFRNDCFVGHDNL